MQIIIPTRFDVLPLALYLLKIILSMEWAFDVKPCGSISGRRLESVGCLSPRTICATQGYGPGWCAGGAKSAPDPHQGLSIVSAVKNGAPSSVDHDLRVDIVASARKLQDALVPVYRYKSILIDGTFAGPQARSHLHLGSADSDGSAAASPEAHKSAHCTRPGQLCFDKCCSKLATLAVESFKGPGKSGAEFVDQITASIIVGGANNGNLDRKGVVKGCLHVSFPRHYVWSCLPSVGALSFGAGCATKSASNFAYIRLFFMIRGAQIGVVTRHDPLTEVGPWRCFKDVTCSFLSPYLCQHKYVRTVG